MSKTQKILTLLAMIAFCVIIALHHKTINYWEPGFGMYTQKRLVIADVTWPLLTLAVLYVGSLALTWKRKSS